MKTFLKIALPLVVIVIGAGVAALMIMGRPPVQPREPVTVAPFVRVKIVQPTTVTLSVDSQGTVQPRSMINVISEVAGVIVKTSDALAAGGYFEQGDVLIEIDPRDYELALVQAEARLREAEARLLREEAEAAVARAEWIDLGRPGEPSALLLREPQLAEARALVASATANMELARRDLEKTKWRAPFPGRVLEKMVDVGQFVARGAQVARIYSVDVAEIRLPITAEEVGFLRLPFAFHGEAGEQSFPEVKLRASYGGHEHEWTGKIVRTEGEIDPRTRMINAVAAVPEPYGRQPGKDRPPLAAGMFVSATISGRTMENMFRLPRIALRGADTLLVVDATNRLWSRAVEVLRADHEEVIVQSGLKAGDRVCLTPLEAPVDGMDVRIAAELENGGPQ